MKGISETIPLKEADIKRSVEDWLQYQQNLGRLIFHRLNAGDFIVVEGESRRRIKGQGKGTADYLVIQPATIQFKHFTELSPEHHIVRATYVEIKSETGRTTKEQDEFAEKVRQKHCKYFIVRSIEELEEALDIKVSSSGRIDVRMV